MTYMVKYTMCMKALFLLFHPPSLLLLFAFKKARKADDNLLRRVQVFENLNVLSKIQYMSAKMFH